MNIDFFAVKVSCMTKDKLSYKLVRIIKSALAAAAVPGAIFSSWHNISGSILAWLYVNYLNPRFDEELQGNVNTISGKPSAAH